MPAILNSLTGYRLMAGEYINTLVAVCNNLTGFGTPQALTAAGQTFSGTLSVTPQFLTAAGTTQGGATAITSQLAYVTVATTNSNHGVILPAASTGLQVTVVNANASHGNKIYPAVGAKISSATTNTSISLTKNKTITFRAITKTAWIAQAGA
jgi:hypothetical protein